MREASSIRSTVLISLFTALTAIGAYLAIPVGPVPIVLQNFFVLLAGILLGKSRGAAVVTTYLILGAIGLPVFHSGTGGLGILFGPTGGYLFGYLPAVYVTGLLSERKKGSFLTLASALIAGTLVIYGVGVPWLKIILKVSWIKAVSVGLIPFIPGDILKIIAAIPIVRWIHPVVEAFLYTENYDTP